MTGAPAETWRKFRFATPPWWALGFLILICVGIGVVVSIPLAYLVARRASGSLPLTYRSRRRVELPRRAAIVILALSALLWILTVIAFTRPYDPANPTPQLIGLVLFNLGLVTFAFGAVLLQIGLQLGRIPFGPGAIVMRRLPGHSDRQVELIRVHPAFVAAVRQMQSTPPPQST
jgi:hypothetical protein